MRQPRVVACSPVPKAVAASMRKPTARPARAPGGASHGWRRPTTSGGKLGWSSATQSRWRPPLDRDIRRAAPSPAPASPATSAAAIARQDGRAVEALDPPDAARLSLERADRRTRRAQRRRRRLRARRIARHDGDAPHTAALVMLQDQTRLAVRRMGRPLTPTLSHPFDRLRRARECTEPPFIPSPLVGEGGARRAALGG